MQDNNYRVCAVLEVLRINKIKITSKGKVNNNFVFSISLPLDGNKKYTSYEDNNLVTDVAHYALIKLSH